MKKSKVLKIAASLAKISTALLPSCMSVGATGLQEIIDELKSNITEECPDICEIPAVQNLSPDKKEYILQVCTDILEKANPANYPDIDQFDVDKYVNQIVDDHKQNIDPQDISTVKRILADYLPEVNKWAAGNEEALVLLFEQYAEKFGEIEQKIQRLQRENANQKEINARQAKSIEEILKSIAAILSDMKRIKEQHSLSENEWKAKLDDYYKGQIANFEKKNDTDSKEILGIQSLSEAYIEPMTKVGDDLIPLLNAVENWFNETESGVLLVHGQPGHGKTTFSQKLVYDFKINGRFRNASEVLQFPLRKWQIGTPNDWNFDSIFRKYSMRPNSQIITLDDIPEGALLILDGFDEIALRLSEVNINGYCGLKETFEEIAREQKIHIIITSRTNAVKDYTDNAFKFAPLTYEQQENWCSKDNDYKARWEEYFKDICADESEKGTRHDFRELLTIPFIFRMVVHCNYRMQGNENNQAKLYESLFEQTMRRLLKNPRDSKINELSKSYQQLAYHIWCNDEDTAVIDQKEQVKFEEAGVNGTDYLLFSYYLREKEDSNEQRSIGFLHRSFYQYYMALYLYEEMKKCTEANSIDFLKKLAERRLDEDILKFFSEIAENRKNKPGEQTAINSSARILLKQVEESECIIHTEVKITTGDAEQSLFDRCNNIFFNSLRLVFCFEVLENFNSSIRVKHLLARYDCYGINLCGVNLKSSNLNSAHLVEADLSNANLSNAHLGYAHLSYADLRYVDLSYAFLIYASLCSTNLSNANLRVANLRSADLRLANLREANLRQTNLCSADLSGANLCSADLRLVNLREANLRSADLSGANLSSADLIFADLSFANLRHADLSSANMNSADLWEANLSEANLSEANLRSADLRRVHFDDAQFVNATFDHTKFTESAFLNSDLKDAPGTFLLYKPNGECYLYPPQDDSDSPVPKSEF